MIDRLEKMSAIPFWTLTVAVLLGGAFALGYGIGLVVGGSGLVPFVVDMVIGVVWGWAVMSAALELRYRA